MLAFPTDRLDVQLNLNGFHLNGVDSRGVFWHTTFGKVSGVFDGVGTSLKTTQKTWNDGAYSNIPVRAGRTITIDGWLMGKCTPTLVASWNDFKRSLQVREQRLRVTLDGSSLSCTVMQASAPLIKWEGRAVLSYSVELFACDPRLYSDKLLVASTGAFVAVVVALIVYNGAILGEALRAGMLSLNKGQREAGLSIGLTPIRTRMLIELPQAFTQMLPIIMAQLVVLLKDTSLGYIVGYYELLRTVKNLSTFFGNYYMFTFWLVVAVIYLAINVLVSWLGRRAARAVAAKRA